MKKKATKKVVEKSTEEKKAPAKKIGKKKKLSPIQELANDINKVLGVDPELDIQADDLENQIKEILPEIQSEDGLTETSFEMLRDMGWGKKTKREGGKKESNNKGKEEKTSLKKPEGALHRGARAVPIDNYVGKKSSVSISACSKETGVPPSFVKLHLLHLLKDHDFEFKIEE